MTTPEDNAGGPADKPGGSVPPDEGKADAARLLAWLMAELKAKPDRKVRGLLLLEGARLLERGGRVAEAAKTLVTSANTDPQLLPALWALIHLFVKRKSWKNIGRLREAEKKAARLPAERSAASAAHGELLEDHLGQPAAALAAYEAAAAESPADLHALLDMERAAVANGDLARLALALERLAAACADPRSRALFLLDLAALQQSLPEGSSGRALEILGQAVEIEDGRWHWLGALERFARAADLPASLAEALEGRGRIMAAFASVETASEAARSGAPRVRDPAEAAGRAAALLRQAARLRQQVGEEQAGLEDLRAAFELAPEDGLVVADLVRLLEGRGLAAEAREVLERRLGFDPTGSEGQLRRLELADLLAGLGEVDAAAEQYRAVLAAEPGWVSAIVGAEELLAGAGRWEELASMYAAVARAAEPAELDLAAALRIRAAEIQDRHLSLPEQAVELLLGVKGAPRDLALSRHAAAAILTRTERWRELASVLDELVDLCEDDATASAALAELASIQLGKLGEPVVALSTYGRLLEREPEASWALELMAELHAGLEQWGELASVYRRMAEASDSDEHAAACLAVAGWLLHTRATDEDGAAACYRASLDRRPDGALAAAGLEELLRRGRDDGGLRALFRGRADAALDPDEAERALLALALDHERAGEAEEAARVYREILDRRGESAGARCGLLRSLRRLGKWEELVDAIEAELERLGAPADQAALLLEQAEVLLDRLGQPDSAEAALRRAREAAPELVHPVLLLADAARAAASWGELDDLLQELLARTPEAALLVAEERLALLAGPARDDDGADLVADVLLENVPEHRPALLSKALLGASRGDHRARVDSLRSLARLEGPTPAGVAIAGMAERIARLQGIEVAPGPLAQPGAQSPAAAVSAAEAGALGPESAPELLELRRDACGDRSARVVWDLDLAEALLRSGEPQAARGAFERVLAVAPAMVPALEGLREVSAGLGLWEPRAEATERLAELAGGEAAAAALWSSAARTWDLELGDPIRAELACRRALTLDPRRGDAFARLLEVLGRKGDHAGQLELLDERIGRLEEPVELATLLVVQAALHRRLRDDETAVECLETALLMDPSNREALRARSLLLLGLESWEPAVSALVAEAEHAEGEEKRLALFRASEVLDEKLGRPSHALQPLRLLVEARDQEPETYARLLALGRRARSWPDVARALGFLATTLSPEDEIVALRAEGRVRGELSADPEGARRAWKTLVDLRPDDAEAVQALAALSQGADRVKLLDDLEARVRSALRNDPTDADGLRALARVHRLAGRGDGVLLVLQVLDAIGQADQGELRELADFEAGAIADPQRPLAAEALRARLRHPGQTGAAEGLHAVLGPILHRVYAADVSSLDLGRPLRSRGGDLLVERVGAAGEVLGLAGIVIRSAGGDPFAVFAVPAEEPTIAVGAQVSGSIGPQLRFRLGRALWHALWRSAALADRTEVQLRALQDAATREGERSFVPSERRLGVDALQREIHRHLPRRSRKALTEAAQLAAKASDEAMSRWCRAIKASADRAGLLLAGDVRAALPDVVPGWRGADAAERTASLGRLRASHAGRALLGFAISPDHLLLREEVGMGVRGW